MKIVVCGAGKIGETLCLDLCQEGHDLMLIDREESVLERMIARADISGVVGNAAAQDVMLEAGVPDADAFISMTSSDEVNLISAIIANKLGAKHTIARIRNPEYSAHMSFMRGTLGLTRLINPDLEAARDIARTLSFPGAYGVETFVNGRANMIEVKVPDDSEFDGVCLKDLRTNYPTLLICAVSREEDVYIPNGDFVISSGDRLQFTGNFKDMRAFYNALRTYQGKLKSILIVGGGRITHYLLDFLQGTKRRVMVIERDERIAEQLATSFPKTEVIHGDGTDFKFLDEHHIEHFDTLVAMTGVDEENAVINLFANKRGVPRSIIKVSRTEMLEIFPSSGLQTIITPKRIVADSVLRQIRALENSQGSNVEELYRLFNNRVEALEFTAKEGARCLNTPLMQLETKDDVLLAFIYRNSQMIFPGGRDMILPGDRVIVITKSKNFDDLDDILAN